MHLEQLIASLLELGMEFPEATCPAGDPAASGRSVFPCVGLRQAKHTTVIAEENVRMRCSPAGRLSIQW